MPGDDGSNLRIRPDHRDNLELVLVVVALGEGIELVTRLRDRLLRRPARVDAQAVVISVEVDEVDVPGMAGGFGGFGGHGGDLEDALANISVGARRAKAEGITRSSGVDDGGPGRTHSSWGLAFSPHGQRSRSAPHLKPRATAPQATHHL